MRIPVVKGSPVGVAAIWSKPYQIWQFIRYILHILIKNHIYFNVTFPSMHSVGRNANFQMYMYFLIMIHLHACIQIMDVTS